MKLLWGLVLLALIPGAVVVIVVVSPFMLAYSMWRGKV